MDEITFKDKAINYLQDRGILVGKIEEGSETSFVFHVAPDDRVKVTGDFKAEMEAELNAYVEPSDMGRFSVVIVEAKESDEEDNSEEDETETTDDESVVDENKGDAEDSESEAETIEDETTAKYKFLSEVSRVDTTGTPQVYPAGAIVELPASYGDTLVEQGQAEKVIE